MAFSLESFQRKYATEITPLSVNGRNFKLLMPRDIQDFIDPEDPVRNFPLWAKVWEASLILADFMAAQPPDSERRILEIGAGMGMVGVVAAGFGHRVTSTEYNPDALAFARANAHINGCRHLEIRHLDWHRPDMTETFDRIIGSEVVFRGTDFQPLRQVFNANLAADGDIVITSGMRKTDMAFFREMQRHYDITVRKKTLRSADEAKEILLCRMTPKPHP